MHHDVVGLPYEECRWFMTNEVIGIHFFQHPKDLKIKLFRKHSCLPILYKAPTETKIQCQREYGTERIVTNYSERENTGISRRTVRKYSEGGNVRLRDKEDTASVSQPAEVRGNIHR